MIRRAEAAPCPCGRMDARGRPLALGQCCGPYLADFAVRPAPDAETLMRSRYTAFVRGDTGYLLATWHPRTRPAELAVETAVRWLGLEVRDHSQVNENTAQVEFVARYRSGGRGARLHERSRFERADARWYYVDGDHL